MILGDGVTLGSGQVASIWCIGDVPSSGSAVATKGSKTKNGRWKSRKNSEWVVPTGYTQLEYIQSDGAEYIDTGVLLADGFRCEIKFNLLEAPNPSDIDVLCAANWLLVSYLNDAYRIYTNGTASTTVSNMLTQQIQEPSVSYVNGTLSLTVNGSTYTAAGSGSSATTLKLFARTSTYGFSKTRLYRCKMYSGNTAVRDFVPCKRNSDNAIGLYDAVNDTFYDDELGGEFIGGNAIEEYVYGMAIDNIDEYGTWTVTASDGTSSVSKSFNIDAAMSYDWDVDLSYFTEAELVSMGCRISRSVGDQILCSGRYIQRVATNPLVVFRMLADGTYSGYGIISNAPITEAFTESEYGAVTDATAENLTAYVKRMAYAMAGTVTVYLNSSDVTYTVPMTGATINESYVDTINKIARSIAYW